MSSIKRLARSFFRLLLPSAVMLGIVALASSIFLIHTTADVPKGEYVVTPAKYGLLSARGAKITDETWKNIDGTTARGWLLPGTEGAPAIILLHRYGTDRSLVLNLGVKLNESGNYTILMPDLRGHGMNPLVSTTTFGETETQDLLSAIDYLRNLKAPSGGLQVGKEFGVYGVEMGALVALAGASRTGEIKTLALDSVPYDSGEVIHSAISKRYPFATGLTSRLALAGAYLYFLQTPFSNAHICDAASAIKDRKMLFVSGTDTPQLQASTEKVADCFAKQGNIERKTDLMSGGYNIVTPSTEQSEQYDNRIIEFFKRNLAHPFLPPPPTVIQQPNGAIQTPTSPEINQTPPLPSATAAPSQTP